MRARCEQCGSLWQLDAPAVQPGQPYQCNACGHIFTIALEEHSVMQIRHTNGKIYKVKDLPTLLRWVAEKRVPRQSMIRGEGGTWQEAMNIPEVADAFAELDARRQKRRESLAAARAETAPPDQPASVAKEEAVDAGGAPKLSADDIAAMEEAEAAIRALDAAIPAVPETPQGDPFEGLLVDDIGIPAAPADADSILAQALTDGDVAEDAGEFDEAFDLLDQMTQEPSNVPGLALDNDEFEDVFDDEVAPPKKSKLPLVAAAVVVLGAGGYFALSGGSKSAPAPSSPAANALSLVFDKGLEALGADNAKNRAAVIGELEAELCLKGCDGEQCVKDDKGGCGLDPSASNLAPFAFLADRLWLESNQVDAYLQKLATAAQKRLAADEKSPVGAARLAAFADFWNSIQPTGSEVDNRAAALVGKLANATPRRPDTAVLIALKQLDGGQAAAAVPLLDEATNNKDRKANSKLVSLARARISRAQAKPGGCGAVSEAYLATVKEGLPSASKELAFFLAFGGDLSGAAKAAGERSKTDPALGGIARAAVLGPELSDAQLKARFAAKNKVTMRNKKSKKIISFLYNRLAKNPQPTQDRGNTLKGIQEMFPNAIKELEESAWIEVILGQQAEGDAKAAHGAEALKRFDRVLGVDPNRRDALLGRAAAGALMGKAADHLADAYGWIFAGVEDGKGLCAAK